MEIRMKTGTVITITEPEMPVAVSGAQTNDVDVVDVIECAKAIKNFCANAECCGTCPFSHDGGHVCKLASGAPDAWEV